MSKSKPIGINFKDKEVKNFLNSFESIEKLNEYYKKIKTERDQILISVNRMPHCDYLLTGKLKERFERFNHQIDIIDTCLCTTHCENLFNKTK